MKTHRIIDGEIWNWESCKIGNDDFIRMIKIADLTGEDGHCLSIGDFSERLINWLIETDKPIIYNLG